MKTGILNVAFRRTLATLALAAAVALAAPVHALAETTFTFNGGGWGHGIGLSQWGSRGYANQGKSYSWILNHYYQGTKLVTKDPVTVKVNLDKSANSRTSWWIQSGTGSALSVIQVSDSNVRASLNGTDRYWITTDAGNTRVHRDETYQFRNADGTYSTKHRPGAVVKAFTGACYATAGGRVRIVGSSGPFDHSGVAWRGTIRFLPYGDTKSKAVNYVGIEYYLYGVVPRESPSSWPAEALKAQAVAARSYAYQDAKDGNTIYCTTMSQVYNGHSRPGHNHEAASTNDAVNATKGQLVWYGTETKPVKTFFFSSSGGHTANVEDVWLSSAARPYYKGVYDPDNDSPNYRWTAGPYSASYVAGKVRAKVGTSYSAPYPYVVTGMSLERASSGFTRYVTVSWSNGTSYKIKGDTMRSALGLKSTKFGVTILKPPVNRYQQSDSRIAWAGIWWEAKHKEASNGTYRYSPQYSSLCVAKFNGTGISWIGNRGPAYGKAEVLIDGKHVATIDQYSSVGKRQQTLFSKNGLPAGEHTLMIKALRAKNTKSTGYSSTVDRIDVIAGTLLQATTPVSKYEQDHSHVGRMGLWPTATGSGFSGGSHITSNRQGDRIVVDFIGTGITWIGSKSANYGSAQVSIDGGTPVTVSLYSDATVHRESLYTSPSLASNKSHRMVIEVAGSQNISVDQLQVRGGWLLTPALPLVRLEESSMAIAESGTWTVGSSAYASGGKYVRSKTAGDEATLTFDGTYVAWKGPRSLAYGKADVLLDGVKVATVDLYSATTKHQQTLFSRDKLAAKRHTLTIRVLGQKGASATDTNVAIDAFEVKGQAGL